MKPKFRVDVLTGIMVLPREIEVTSESFFFCCEVNCTNQKQFSFRWIQHEFVVVSPGNNVTEG